MSPLHRTIGIASISLCACSGVDGRLYRADPDGAATPLAGQTVMLVPDRADVRAAIQKACTRGDHLEMGMGDRLQRDADSLHLSGPQRQQYVGDTLAEGEAMRETAPIRAVAPLAQDEARTDADGRFHLSGPGGAYFLVAGGGLHWQPVSVSMFGTTRQDVQSDRGLGDRGGPTSVYACGIAPERAH